MLATNEINLDDSLCIGGWYIDTKVCDNLIKYFEESELKEAGKFGSGEGFVDLEVKDSTDIYLEREDLLASPVLGEYISEVFKALEEFKNLYPYSTLGLAAWGFNPQINLKRYIPGQAYHGWHCERPNTTPGINERHLSFLTYLNDVTDGGETEFLHQGIKIKPERGLTVISGCDWTAVHRGLPSPTETKYIASGWFSYTL
jgi:hypothetical protein